MKFFGKKALAGPAGSAMPKRRLKLPSGGLVAGTLLAMLAAIFMGMVTALGSLPLTLVVAGAMLGLPMLILINTRQLLPVLFVVVFLIQGTAQFYLHLRAATWMASGLAAMFLARAIIEVFDVKRLRAGVQPGPGAGNVLLFASLYVMVYLLSMAMGSGTTAQRISSLRFSIPMFGVLLALYWYHWDIKQLKRLWWLIIAISMCQLPLTLYQHFFMMGTLGWDGVVGSFGGNLSPVLVLFVLAALMYSLALWTRGMMPVWLLSGIFMIGIAVILLGEVKAVLFWLPVAVAYVLRRRILRNVLQLLMFACLSVVFLAGTYTAYKAMYWTVHTKDDTLAEKLDGIVGYAIDPDNINYRTGEISRGASIALWYRDPVPGSIKKLIGYGPGSTIISANTGLGQVAARYRGLGVGTTTVSNMLWDLGILGTVAFITFLSVGVWCGWRYGKVVTDPERAAIADTATAILALMLSTVVYNRTLVDEPTAQLLCFFCLGCIVQLRRFDRTAAKVRAPRPIAPPGPFLVQTS